MRHRDRSPSNGANWRLDCRACKQRFSATMPIGNVQKHFIAAHGTEQIDLDLVWVGIGPAPKSVPERFN